MYLSFSEFYPNFSGAAIMFPIKEFIGINGASLTNECWRCENDDLYQRYFTDLVTQTCIINCMVNWRKVQSFRALDDST